MEESPRYIRNPDVVLREEDADGGLLFNPDTNQVKVVNTTGLFIWQQCDGARDLAEIVGAVQEARFTLKGREFVIERNEQGFFQKDPENRFQQFLHDMVRIKVVRFLAEPLNMEDERFASPEGAIDLKIQEEGKDARELRIEIGEQSPEGWYGRISDLPQGLFVLPENFVEEFAKRFKGLPDR